MKKYLLALFAVVLWPAADVLAQQEPQFTHYMFNTLVYNPAYAGSQNGICADLLYHNQWTNFTGPDDEGAPITQTFGIHSGLPITIKGNKPLGAGFHVYNDQEGFIGTTGFMLSGSYNFPLQWGNLRVGLNGGMVNKSLDGKWHPEEQGDTRIPGTSSSTTFDAGAGAYFTAVNWYAGISALHLPAGTIKWEAQSAATDYKVARTFFATAGYNYAINGDPNLMLMPSFFVKKDIARTSFALNAMFLYKERFWAALNYRSEQLTATSLMLGMYIKGPLRVGYSYDIGTKSSSVFGGTHEIYVGYCFTIKVTPDTDVPPVDPRNLGHPRSPSSF